MHGDIKPDNIVVDTETGTGNMIKLIDFGLTYIYRLVYEHKFRGTKGFMPPENVPENEPQQAFAEKIDVFPVGVIAFWLRVCAPPF